MSMKEIWIRNMKLKVSDFALCLKNKNKTATANHKYLATQVLDLTNKVIQSTY